MECVPYPMHMTQFPSFPRCAALFSIAVALCGRVQAEDPALMVQEGDAHAAKLETKEALKCYTAVEKVQPTNADLLVKIAREYRHLMSDASADADKLKLGAIALDYGKRAATSAPSNSDAQLSCAVSYGKMVPLMSKKEQVSKSKLIKEGAERAIRLDPSNDLAWHILGRWHRNVAGMSSVTRTLAAMVYEKLPEASNDEAKTCFERSIKLNPHRLINYIELGRTYAQMGRPDEAKRYINKGLNMPSTDKDDSASKATGREVLSTIN